MTILIDLSNGPVTRRVDTSQGDSIRIINGYGKQVRVRVLTVTGFPIPSAVPIRVIQPGATSISEVVNDGFLDIEFSLQHTDITSSFSRARLEILVVPLAAPFSEFQFQAVTETQEEAVISLGGAAWSVNRNVLQLVIPGGQITPDALQLSAQSTDMFRIRTLNPDGTIALSQDLPNGFIAIARSEIGGFITALGIDIRDTIDVVRFPDLTRVELVRFTSAINPDPTLRDFLGAQLTVVPETADPTNAVISPIPSRGSAFPAITAAGNLFTLLISAGPLTPGLYWRNVTNTAWVRISP